MAPQDVPEHEHFSEGTRLAFAVVVDLVAVFVAVLWLGNSFFVSGLAVAAGAVVTAVLVRRTAGRRWVWLCVVLAVAAVIIGAVLELSLSLITFP